MLRDSNFFQRVYVLGGFPHDVFLLAWRIFRIPKRLAGRLSNFSTEFLKMPPLFMKKKTVTLSPLA